MMADDLVAHFSEIDDPRCAGKVEHRLMDVLVIAVCATIAGSESWEDMALYGRSKEAWLSGFLPLAGGIPSHDTFRRVFILIDPDAFARCCTAWAASMGSAPDREVVAIDYDAVKHLVLCRVLRACRKTAVQARRIALQMIGNTIVSAPDALRDSVRHLTRMKQIRTLAARHPDLTGYREMEAAYRIALKSLARRYLELHDEIADLDVMIKAIVDELAPELVERNSIGYHSAAQLLITAAANPDRLKSEASFAALCGVSPVPASSGKTSRHRLNRGGDRAANSALHIIAICRLRCDERTQTYVARRIAGGLSKLEAIRCLKRYIAREVFNLIRNRYSLINQTQIAA